MKFTVTTAALGVLLLAAATGAKEGDAPLSGSKKELQQLQSDRKNPGAPSASDGLRGGVPALHFPAQAEPVPQMKSIEKRERDSQQRQKAQKNWLLDGMAKLERESDGKSPLPGEADAVSGETEDGAEKIDTSDPVYLLKLYDRQKKTEEAKSTEAKERRLPQNDAFAPFLQGWMAASPVKDQLLNNRGHQNATGAALVPGADAPSALPGGRGAGAAPLSEFSRGAVTEAKPNPYLGEQPGALLPGPSGGLASMPTVPAGSLNPAPVTVISPGPAGPRPPAAEPVPADRKAPPPPLADDKKYFPQLNKF